MYAGVDRFVASTFAERRRIERALHDGAAQDLVAVSVRLQLLRGVLEGGSDEALALLDEIRGEVADALDRLRALAGDVYPSILEARGLGDAIRVTLRASSLAARVDDSLTGRFPLELEAAAYFACRSILDRLEP
jgi:signal transduction histidine kinase